MFKFYKLVDGTKMYCDENGALATKDGENVEVPETDTDAVNVEDATTTEVSRMLNKAMADAIAKGDEETQKRVREAEENFSKFFEALGQTAKTHTPRVEVVEHKSSFDLESVMRQIEPMKKGSKGSATFTIKDTKDLEAFQKSTSVGVDLTGDVIQPDRDMDITRDPQRAPFMEEISDTVATDSNVVEWVEVVTETGAPATTAELTQIPEKDFKFQTFRQPVEKIAVMNKHSVELLKHGPELVAAIRRMLNLDMRLETDAQLLSGNGAPPNLQGVLGVATELDATAVGAQRVANANLFDVLRIGATKIASSGKGQFIPNFVVLNPADTEKFDLTKNEDGDYIMPPFYDAAGRRIRGARIIENTGIDADTFLMGDFNYLHVRPNGGMEVELTNADGTDFAHDILSIKMRRFLAAYVKNNENAAFQTGTISDVIAALVAAS